MSTTDPFDLAAAAQDAAEAEYKQMVQSRFMAAMQSRGGEQA